MGLQPGAGHGLGIRRPAGPLQRLVQPHRRLLRIGLGAGLPQGGHRRVPLLAGDVHLAFQQPAVGQRRLALLQLARQRQRLLGLLLAHGHHHPLALRGQMVGLQLQHPLQAAAGAGQVTCGQLRVGQAQVRRG